MPLTKSMPISLLDPCFGVWKGNYKKKDKIEIKIVI